MKRAALLIATLVLAAACGDDDAATTTTVPQPTQSPTTVVAPPTTAAPTSLPTATTTVPITVAPTTTAAPATTTTAPAATTTTVVMATDDSLTERFWAVVLVDGDDVLNVRTGPGVEFPKLTSFNPTQTGIVLTGKLAQVGGSTWVEVETEDARGWVNKFYLTEEWTTAEIEVRWNMQTPLDDFGLGAATLGDLSDPVSARGLFVVYHDEQLRRWEPNQLDDLMVSPTTYEWSTPACEGDCVEDTFAGAVGLPFVSVWEDTDDDALVGLDDILLGGNGPFPPESAIPTQFQNFHFVVVHDPGDDPELDGLDWQSWFVYYDYENGEAKIVGLSRAAWGP